MPEVTLEWLQKEAKQLVKKHWGMKEIPDIVIVSSEDSFSQEYRLEWGKFYGFYISKVKTVAMNNEINKLITLRGVKRILLHELTHWYLHITDQKWRDEDERFARELIRVGLGRRHNTDDQSQAAAQEAWRRKKDERFEIVERSGKDILTTRLSHHRKNIEDFKKDLAVALIKIHNEREEDESLYPSDVADLMKRMFGYKTEPLPVFSIELSAGDGYGNGEIGDGDDIAQILTDLDCVELLTEGRLKNVSSDYDEY